MRILMINPNMTEAMTESMATVATATVPVGVEIAPVTAARGFPYVPSRAGAQIAGGIVLDPIAAAIRQAVALARLAPRYGMRTERPAAKPYTGLGPALQAVIAGAAP